MAKQLTPEMRRTQTRTYLLDAAAEVFGERGFHGASLDTVAEAAGYSKGAVYSHFGSKEELFLALYNQRIATMVEDFFAVVSQDHDSPEARLSAISSVYAQLNPTEAEWSLWTEFTLYALRGGAELRTRRLADAEAGLDAVTAMVDGIYPDLNEGPLSARDLARTYTALFSGLAEQRALDPHGVNDDLFGRAVLLIHDAVLRSDV